MGMIATIASPPVQLNQLLTAVQTDWLSLLIVCVEIASIALYFHGVRRLERKGRKWPKARTVSFVSGIVLVWIATGSGLASYDDSVFTVHVIQHLLLMNFAPIFIALSAPITLLIQAGSRSVQTRTISILHTKPIRFITFPFLVWILNYATMYIYFLTPVYELSIRHPLFHDYTHLQFLVVGLLFWTTVVGVDPSGWKLGNLARLGFILSGIPFSAFLGIALMGTKKTISPAHTLTDIHSGGSVLWAFGELTNVIALVVVAAQWAKSDQREAERMDRILDRELAEGAGPDSRI